MLELSAGNKARLVEWLAMALVLVLAYAAHAYHYVQVRIDWPTAEPGYESDWQFQLMMFAIFRFPFWIGIFIFGAMSMAASTGQRAAAARTQHS